MGSGASSAPPMPSIATLQNDIRQEWIDIFVAMKIKREEIGLFYQIFRKIDKDNSGFIDIVELLTFLDVERNKFTERIFSAFDKDGTGSIDFYEFVVSLWKFCTLGNGELCKYSYD